MNTQTTTTHKNCSSIWELMLDFAYATRSWPPSKTYQDARQFTYKYTLNDLDPSVTLPNYQDAVRTFDDALLLMSRLHGKEVCPWLKGTTNSQNQWTRPKIDVLRIGTRKAVQSVKLQHSPKLLQEQAVMQHQAVLLSQFPHVQTVSKMQVRFLMPTQGSPIIVEAPAQMPANQIAYNTWAWRRERQTKNPRSFRQYASNFEFAVPNPVVHNNTLSSSGSPAAAHPAI